MLLLKFVCLSVKRFGLDMRCVVTTAVTRNCCHRKTSSELSARAGPLVELFDIKITPERIFMQNRLYSAHRDPVKIV